MNNNINNGQVNNPAVPNQPIPNGAVPPVANQQMQAQVVTGQQVATPAQPQTPVQQPVQQVNPQMPQVGTGQPMVGQLATPAQPQTPVPQPVQQANPQIPQGVQQVQKVQQPVATVQPQPSVQAQQPSVQAQQSSVQAQQPSVQAQQQSIPAPVQGQPNTQMMPGQGMPIVQPQPIPVQPNAGLQVAAPVVPIKQEAEQTVNLNPEIKTEQEMQSSVVEEKLAPKAEETFDSNSVDSITVDYNALYGVSQEKAEEKVEVQEERPIFTAQDIVIETNSLENRRVDDVVPEFNLNALDGSVDENGTGRTDNILTDKQQDRADTRRRIIFISVLFLVIIVIFLFVFPIIAGYNY